MSAWKIITITCHECGRSVQNPYEPCDYYSHRDYWKFETIEVVPKYPQGVKLFLLALVRDEEMIRRVAEALYAHENPPLGVRGGSLYDKRDISTSAINTYMAKAKVALEVLVRR
jgi:hypothetical protein